MNPIQAFTNQIAQWGQRKDLSGPEPISQWIAMHMPSFLQAQYEKDLAAGTNPALTNSQVVQNVAESFPPNIMTGEAYVPPSIPEAATNAAVRTGIDTSGQLASGKQPKQVFSPGNVASMVGWGLADAKGRNE